MQMKLYRNIHPIAECYLKDSQMSVGFSQNKFGEIIRFAPIPDDLARVHTSWSGSDFKSTIGCFLRILDRWHLSNHLSAESPKKAENLIERQLDKISQLSKSCKW